LTKWPALPNCWLYDYGCLQAPSMLIICSSRRKVTDHRSSRKLAQPFHAGHFVPTTQRAWDCYCKVITHKQQSFGLTIGLLGPGTKVTTAALSQAQLSHTHCCVQVGAEVREKGLNKLAIIPSYYFLIPTTLSSFANNSLCSSTTSQQQACSNQKPSAHCRSSQA